MNKTSIVIVSYNNMYLMQKCIESFRNTCDMNECEIIVVDNASTDGVREWLAGQEDLKVILLDENVGFPMGCNIGAQYAEPGYDIFLLNNDTRLCKRSLENLREALYSDEMIGAAGSVANYAGNEQEILVEFDMPNDYVSFGSKNNVDSDALYEYRPRLCGFAMLIKREIWDTLGGLDEEFSPGYIEDDDLSMRISMLGYRLVVCKNSFIYHVGSQSFAHKEGLEDIIGNHLELFRNRYGFDARDYIVPNRQALDRLVGNKGSEFNMLIVGAGLGADIDYVQTKFPKARIVGVEFDEHLFKVASRSRMLVNSVEELASLVEGQIFSVLYINPQTELCEDNFSKIRKMCSANCIIIR